MYTRVAGCPFVTLAKRVLDDYGLDYREVFIDRSEVDRQRLLDWVGFLSVPTLIAAEPGQIVPYDDPEPLARGLSPRGIDRGSMITEPNIDQLTNWLTQHGFITAAHT
jgi:glutaredoxin